jgi:demethylmenaquinone methyltransferase / 2-methoxy-6-polyprenyl-1,4-benzoquinol methylase
MSREVSYGYKKILPEEKRRLIQEHFDTIAHRYDLADALLSFGLHFLWRRQALQWLGLKPGDTVLDLCGGTADFAVLAAATVAPAGKVVVCDISPMMMTAGQRKADKAGVTPHIEWVVGDAEEMGFENESFDAVIVGYGIRNFVCLEKGLAEIQRVLKTNGRFLAMEFTIPKATWLKAVYHFYSFRIMPAAGKLITGTADPFHYLAESIRVFPPPARIQTLMIANGFANAGFELLSNGLAVLYHGNKASPTIRFPSPPG